MDEPGRGPAIADFRAELHAWLDAHHDELAPPYAAAGDARRADRADAAREVDPVRRGLDAVRVARARSAGSAARRCCAPSSAPRWPPATSPTPACSRSSRCSRPTLIDFAPPALAAEVVPRLLSGAEMWCQGFSEPGTGSDLAALELPGRSRRRRRRPRRRGSINGQKVWTSLAQYSDRCVLLTRTGTAESRHRGITAFFVDMDTPGITVAPIEMINGVREFAEVFFDDVVVPADRILGEVERRLGRRDEHPPVRALVVLLAAHRVPVPPARAARRGRARRRAQRRDRRQRVPAAPRAAGPVARHAAPARRRRDPRRGDVDRQGARRDRGAGDLRRGAPPAARRRRDRRQRAAAETWRTEYLYSRAATIYGGTAEVQRNIIARRLLDLGADE